MYCIMYKTPIETGPLIPKMNIRGSRFIQIFTDYKGTYEAVPFANSRTSFTLFVLSTVFPTSCPKKFKLLKVQNTE